MSWIRILWGSSGKKSKNRCAGNAWKNWKNGGYSFVFRKLSKNVDWKLDEILNYDNGWNMIREEYLKLKNANNDNNKKSYVLYLEAINNVYNWI